jgi:cytochrome oxidase Cu insertion factor (SCO1/SenC/PrrC family)
LRDDLKKTEAVTRQYGVSFSKNPMPDSALGYSISHPTDIFLLDTSGTLVGSVPHDSSTKRLLAQIRDLLNASD